MSNAEQNVVNEKVRDTAQQADATAALMDMYNRTAVELPPDPWIQPSADDEPASEAMDEVYN